MMELLARIEAKLRARAAVARLAEAYQFGAVAIDFRKAEVTRNGQPLDLAAREFQLLRYFIEHRGATLTREELLNEVWGLPRDAVDADRGRARRVAAPEARTDTEAPSIYPHRPRTRLQVHRVSILELTRTRDKGQGRRENRERHGILPCPSLPSVPCHRGLRQQPG
jgi:hypothetical protein